MRTAVLVLMPGLVAPCAFAQGGDEAGRLLLRVGAQGGVADERETDATRFGGYQAAVGWYFRPDLNAYGEIRHGFSRQPYLGLGEGERELGEQRIHALAAIDWRFAPDLWEIFALHLYGGPRFLIVRNDAYRPWMGTVFVGGRVDALLHAGLVADAHGGGGYALFGSDDDTSALGDFKTTWLWGAGLALRFAPWYRLRIGYLGENWVLEHTDRVQHGAELTVQARWF